MCIRDSPCASREARFDGNPALWTGCGTFKLLIDGVAVYWACLLYTSDAADERSSVDLGGRRIIKKKMRLMHSRDTM